MGTVLSLSRSQSGAPSSAAADTVRHDDSRLSDSRAPNGTAGGALNGTYPNPMLDVVPWSPFTLTDAPTIAVNATLSNTFDVTLAGNRMLGNPTGATDGQKIMFRIRQDATGGRTLAFDTKYRFSSDIPSVTLSVTANKLDRIGVEYVAADDKFDVVALNRGH